MMTGPNTCEEAKTPGPASGEPDDVGARPAIFRAAALAARRRAAGPGHPLHIGSTWTRCAVAVAVAAVVTSVAFAATVRVGVYVRGAAVVRRDGQTTVTAAVSARVQVVEVRPGQRVETGQVLVRLDDAAPSEERARLDGEHRQRLAESAHVPAAQAGPAGLADARTVVASRPGVVTGVRVRAGQFIAPGDVLVTIERDAAETVVLGLFPGDDRPLLGSVDTPLSLELEGFPGRRHAVSVRSIADEVIAPAEAMRSLGLGPTDALDPDGSVVVVEAVLASDSFVADGAVQRVRDGMRGTLEARLGSATLLEVLVPALRQLDVPGPPSRALDHR